jgi:outer membrane protein
MLAAALLAALGGLPAQAQEMKVGFVNVAKVFDGYVKTQASDSALEKEGKQKEAELEGRMNELRKLRENLELLGDEARESKTREIEQKADDLQRFRANTARDLRRERDKIAKDLLDEIQVALDEFAKANSYTLILDSRALLYAENAHDITDQVLKVLNAKAAPKKP